MNIARTFDLDLTPEQARARQVELAELVDLTPGPSCVPQDVRWIGATDVAYHKETDEAYAAVVILDGTTMEVVEVATWVGPPGYGYEPGVFALREASCLLGAFEKLERVPDVVLVDGHGLAHPRRFGLACLLGIMLDVPTVGCAKKRLCGTHEPLDEPAGSAQDLIHDGQVVGQVLRTQDGVNPVFVSPGHRYDVQSATALASACTSPWRIPEPLRQAHYESITLRALYASES